MVISPVLAALTAVRAAAAAASNTARTKWLFWGNGGGQRIGDYDTPIGTVENSFSREVSAAAGFGYYPKKDFSVSTTTSINDVMEFLSIPQEVDPEIVELNPRRHSIEFRGGFRETGTFIDAGTFSVQYNDYKHSEIESLTGEIGTSFKNNTFLYQGVFDQRKAGSLQAALVSGDCIAIFPRPAKKPSPRPRNRMRLPSLDSRLSTSNASRSNSADGSKTIATTPTVTRRAVLFPIGVSPVFPARLAFASQPGRADLSSPTTRIHIARRRWRSCTTLDRIRGNLAFEIGDPNLERELGDGIDFGIRHSSKRVRFEANGSTTTSETLFSSRRPETSKMV